MAGHSKWANIRFRKAAQDVKRGKIFTKLIREITIAARMGGDDLESNPRLRDAINKALKANMKRDTVDNAVKRGVGGLDGAEMQELRYEGYGPSGVAILVDCLTDNKNRTVSDVRHAFTKSGGNLGTDGSVAYLFEKQGQISLLADANTELAMDVAIEAEASDVDLNLDGTVDITTTAEHFNTVRAALEKAGIAIENAQVVMESATKIPLDAEAAQKLLLIIDRLEDLDDVQEVYSNADISDDILAAIE